MGSPLSPVIANFFIEDFEKKARDTQACTLVQLCRLYFRHLAPWPRKTDRNSEPPQWTPQQDTVYNGKRRRPSSIPGQ